MDILSKCYEHSAADELRENGIYPFGSALESRQDTEVIMEGKRRIMLGSNNYLGFTVCPEVTESSIKAIEQYGTGCSGSRLLNGTLRIHLELEKELAEFLKKEAVLTFSTGFQTNLGIISAIVQPGDYVVMDRENHASLYCGCKLSYGKMLRFAHNDMKDLEEALKRVPSDAGCLIVTDGVFSMTGDIANLPEICRLAEKYGARVMVDDAHALGVIGEGGRGTASYYGIEDKVDIYMGTFSKTLASMGGYVAASERVIDYLKHNSHPFMFAASIPPSNCAAALAALRQLKNKPELVDKLQHNALYMRQCLKDEGIKMKDSNLECSPIVPIFTYEMKKTFEITKDIYDSGVYVNSSVPPATPANGCLIRTSLMAVHSEEQINEAVGIISKVLKKYGI